MSVVVPSWKAKRLPLLCQLSKCIPIPQRHCNNAHNVFGFKDGSFESFMFLVSEYKIHPCPTKQAHMYTACPYYHLDNEEQDRRRPPDRIFAETGHARLCTCNDFEECIHPHSMLEALYHPSVFRARMCIRHQCYKGICAFSHSKEELEQSKRYRDRYCRLMEAQHLAKVTKTTQEFEEKSSKSVVVVQKVVEESKEEAVVVVEPISTPIQPTAQRDSSFVDKWNVDDVVFWLNRVHLEFMIDEVKKQKVKGKMLKAIDDSTLQRDFHELSTFRRMRVLGELEELLGTHA